MEKIEHKRWMVGLDLTEMDQTIVSWVNYLCSIFKPDAIYFVHVEKNLDMPEYVPDEWSESFKVADEDQRMVIEKILAENFEEGFVETHIEVLEGKPFDTLLHWVQVKKIDLFIAGKKEAVKGSGILPHKLSRKLSCSVIFIPEIAPQEIKKALIPIDFSEHSKLAVETALVVREATGSMELTCLHIYNVPLGYYKTGKSYEEFAEIMAKHAKTEFDRFSGNYDSPLNYKSLLLKDGSVPELVQQEIENDDYQLLILGSKGQTLGSFILLGSTAEKLIQSNSKSLTWIVKKKGENLGFLEALRKI